MATDPRSILVAEDNRVLADVLKFNLERAGFEVVVAENGRIAIEQLKRRSFDLLITDHQMSEVDGEELCSAIREVLHLDHLPIVMCSAKGLELKIEQLREKYQVARVIYKPFSMREVVTLAKSLINSEAAHPVQSGARV